MSTLTLNRFTIRTLTLIALVAPAVALAADADIAVVVNKGNPTNSLTKSQLRKLILADQDSWPNGQKVTLVMRNPGNPEREGVLRSVCRMSEDDYNQYSIHASFNGSSASPVKMLASPEAIRQYVASAPGALGFIPASDVDESVKVLSIDGLTAGEAGYKVKIGK